MKKKPDAVKWLDRGLFTSPVRYGVCFSEAAYLREVKRLKIPVPDQWLNKCADATIHFFEQHGATCCVVCLSRSKRTRVEIYGLLVHEAVHIWQEIREQIGEKNPSAEFEAYSIQAIAQRLMECV